MKTTIDVPKPTWHTFGLLVMQKKGNHKMNEVIVALIERVNKGEIAI